MNDTDLSDEFQMARNFGITFISLFITINIKYFLRPFLALLIQTIHSHRLLEVSF